MEPSIKNTDCGYTLGAEESWGRRPLEGIWGGVTESRVSQRQAWSRASFECQLNLWSFPTHGILVFVIAENL